MLDEAGDMVQYTLFTLIIGYVTKVGPGWCTLGYNTINVVMYSMEVCFLLTQDLNINLNLIIEFGPVELELLIALIIASAGIFGNQAMVTPIIEYLPSAAKIISPTFCWGHFLQGLFMLIMC